MPKCCQGIASLRENEQIVLSLYYERNLHLKEIAQVMELSEPRISQIHTRAIQKLRTYRYRSWVMPKCWAISPSVGIRPRVADSSAEARSISFARSIKRQGMRA